MFHKLEAYRALVVMGFQEVQQGVEALLVLEQLGRQVTVKELHPISDGLGHGRAREGGIEGLKIKLENNCWCCLRKGEVEFRLLCCFSYNVHIVFLELTVHQQAVP